jgi:DNA-binding CsgD family transcriptional regulator
MCWPDWAISLEGLAGSGQLEQAAAVLAQLRAGGGQVGLSNLEIAAELFISRKAVEYHLGNIYAKCGLQGRQRLRRFVEQWRQPSAVSAGRVLTDTRSWRAAGSCRSSAAGSTSDGP